MEYLIYYLYAINIISFIIYGIDKHKAKNNKWRISENVLIGLALIGGFAGAYVGIYVFRHKTKHIKFVAGVPAIAIMWNIGFIIYYLQCTQ